MFQLFGKVPVATSCPTAEVVFLVPSQAAACDTLQELKIVFSSGFKPSSTFQGAPR